MPFLGMTKHPLPDVMGISDRCWELTPS